MDLSKILLEKGWYITDDGFKKAFATAFSTGVPENKDTRKLIAIIMDMDFREIAGGALPAKRDDTIPGQVVLQLQKIRNISAPKSNEDSKAAPRFLQLELSDGQTTIQALELESISSLNMDLPPGTKIYFRAERLQLIQGFLILRSSELQVLGGRVEAMIEKWELARTMQKYARSGRRMSGATGPPPWIQFGKKVESSIGNDRNFKSLQGGTSEGKDNKENEEFNAMRSEAIAEASKAGTKKIFGGGGQQMLDHNVKKIIEKGFSEEDAKQVLRSTNNNLERALYNLKRRGEIKRVEELGSGGKVSQSGSFSSAKTIKGGTTRETVLGKRGGSTAKEDILTTKPAGNVSLFDFLTDKLPIESVLNTTVPGTGSISASNISKSSKLERNKKEFVKNASSDTRSIENTLDSRFNAVDLRFENNMSYSFAANRSPSGVTVNHRGGRSNNDCGSNTTHFNPFRTRGNDNFSSAPHSSGGESNGKIQNQNQFRNSRSSHDHRKASNQLSVDVQESRATDFTNKQVNERPQQQRYNKGEGLSAIRNENRNRFTNKRDGNTRHPNNNVESNNSDAIKTISTQKSGANNAIDELVETTSKIKISKKGHNVKREGRSHKVSQCYVAGQLPNQIQISPQLPNGYNYDTSKIIGFQNKKTNEIAMTLLKSEGLNPSISPIVVQEQEQKSVQPRINYHTSHPTVQMSNDNYVVTASLHLQQPTSQIDMYTSLNPTALATVAPISSNFGMVQGDGWHWKVGDLCFAKYWDDGRYYEAEVTAISDTTCVVFFLGYGNHEEVLKSDCQPITDGNHYPINNYNGIMNYPQSRQGNSTTMTPTHPIQQIQTGTYQRGGGGKQRFHVPPNKRRN